MDFYGFPLISKDIQGFPLISKDFRGGLPLTRLPGKASGVNSEDGGCWRLPVMPDFLGGLREGFLEETPRMRVNSPSFGSELGGS